MAHADEGESYRLYHPDYELDYLTEREREERAARFKKRGAFFGRIDFNLPVVTWAVQTNEQNPSEIDLLWCRARARGAMLWGDGMATFGHTEASLTTYFTQEPFFAINVEEDREELAGIARLTKRMTSDLYDNRKFSMDNLRLLNDAVVRPSILIPPMEDIVSRHVLEEYDITSLGIGTEYSSIKPPIVVAEELKKLLVEASSGKACVARCPECDFVFALSRSDQVYCSNRCNSRVQMRRRRQKTIGSENI